MAVPTVTEQIEYGSRGISSLKITAVEPMVTRTPVSTLPADEFIETADGLCEQPGGDRQSAGPRQSFQESSPTRSG